MMKIPLYKPTYAYDISAVEQCLRSGWVGYGPLCKKVEAMFAQRGGFAVATNSCTAALNVLARTLFSKEQNEVIIPSLTFISTAMAFHDAGWQVKLAGVDPATGLVDTGIIKKLITARTGAVVIVNLYGQNHPGIKEMYSFLKGKNIPLILDLAHRLDDMTIMPEADFCCYSFNAVKEITCGEGGLLWGADPLHETKARASAYLGLKYTTLDKAHSKDHPNDIFTVHTGLKFLLSDIQASVLLNQLNKKHIEDQRRKRKKIFDRYDAAFEHIPFLKPIKRKEDDSWLMYVVKLKNKKIRDQLRSFLTARGVTSGIHYPSLFAHPILSGGRPSTASGSGRLLSLPCYPDMRKADLQYVIDGILVFAAQQKQILCENDIIEIRFPGAHDIRDIIRLRNKPETRKWFFDDAKVNYRDTALWIKKKLKFPENVLLVISLKNNGEFLGTAGWKYTADDEADFGRLMIDSSAVKKTIAAGSITGRHIIHEATALLRTYLFSELKLNNITTSCFKDNRTAAWINAKMGGQPAYETSFVRNGIEHRVIHSELTREKWLQLSQPKILTHRLSAPDAVSYSLPGH